MTGLEQMRAEPDAVAAGGDFDVVFLTGADRGPGFVLEQDTGGIWQFRYSLASHAGEPAPEQVSPAEVDPGEWASGPGYDSTEPHGIHVPDDAEPGRWRICTAPEAPEFCAEFQVTADGP